MTSEHTKQATLDFFKKNKYFGLQEEDVVLFEQSLLPCIGFDGKIILEKPHKVALAPGKVTIQIHSNRCASYWYIVFDCHSRVILYFTVNNCEELNFWFLKVVALLLYMYCIINGQGWFDICDQ